MLNLGENDDSDELPANPGGQRLNSLVRVQSDHTDPLKVLVHGLYRLTFTASKVGGESKDAQTDASVDVSADDAMPTWNY